MKPFRPARRSALLRLSGASLAALLPRLASGDEAAVLNALPRVALVMGNAQYRALPRLRNPANDARALDARLRKVGFATTLHVDAEKNAMQEAVRDFCERVARQKSVALFYFAGHGLQLSWRNYLVPVDARVRASDDVPEQTVDLLALIDGLRKARNAMSIVILDACRDNPFASELKTAKGLSQMDAPAGTLLAYATAPGNTASDGDGENGLYTEHLLNELEKPEAKIEDVFKRVRLNVRRASQGTQVPWESTSLENDFYFVPPAQIRKASNDEMERRYREELETWTRAGKAVETDFNAAVSAVEDYLRRYPSGHFSEIAQIQLDRLLSAKGEKKVAVVDSPANPLSKGTAPVDIGYQAGDYYRWRRIDRLTGRVLGNFRMTVTDAGPTQVRYIVGEPGTDAGYAVTDLLGNVVDDSAARQPLIQMHAAEYAVGRKWETRYRREERRTGSTLDIEMAFVVAARERITVVGQDFHAFRVEGRGWRHLHGGGTTHPGSAKWEFTYWVEPQRVRRVIAQDSFIGPYNPWSGMERERLELVAFYESDRYGEGFK